MMMNNNIRTMRGFFDLQFLIHKIKIKATSICRIVASTGYRRTT